MAPSGQRPLLQEVLWGGGIRGALWPFQPLGWDYLRPPHLHQQPEILIVRRGTVRLRLGAESHLLGPRHIAFVPPSVVHEAEDLKPDTDFWVLQLDLSLVDTALQRVSGLNDQNSAGADGARLLTQLFPDPPLLELSSRAFDVIEQRAALAWQSYLEAWCGEADPVEDYSWIPPWSPAASARATLQLVDVLVSVLEAVLAEGGAHRPRRIARAAFDVMTANPLLPRAALCRELDVSEGYLSRKFPQMFGVSLVTQRARVRLASFLSLAAAQDSNLLEACFSAGFGSYAQLHRVFSSLSRFSPRQYLYGGGCLEAAKAVR